MSNIRDLAVAYAKNHHQEFIDELSSLVKIPSISTSPDKSQDIQRAAHEVARQLASVGLEHVQVLPTKGHPVVYADWLHAGDQPTVLIYGHYDVQPVDPIDRWETGPFDPSIRDDFLFGRGASDMKGQVVAVLSALRSFHVTSGGFPVNLKVMIEGEEEIGSPHLKPFIQDHSQLLACDISLNTDAGMIAADMPNIVYALRGLVFFELRIFGPSHDLHSGVFGGVVNNPAQVLSEIIAGLHDTNGTITIPGFYDRVRPLSKEERGQLARLPMDETFYQNQTGVSKIWGEQEFSPFERVGARPTLEVNGLLSGFTGEGTKTVLPAHAMAKISCRLVADQQPEAIHQAFRTHLAQIVPDTVRWELICYGGAPASATDPSHPAATAMRNALKIAWGVDPALKREGGSVPVVTDIQQILGAESVLTGFGLPDDRIHSPNERLHLPTWYKGIEAVIHFLVNMRKEQEELQ